MLAQMEIMKWTADQRRKVPTALGDLSRLEKERKGEREALEQVTLIISEMQSTKGVSRVTLQSKFRTEEFRGRHCLPSYVD